MEISSSIKDRYIIIEPLEDVTLYNSMEFKKHLSDLIENSTLNIVVDLANIREADSTLISALLFGLRKMDALGREFALINVNEEILSILKLANIINKFRLYESYGDLI